MVPDDGELYGHVNTGLALYDAGLYFEAHEVWEHAWGGEVGRTKIALQSLIQIAAAMYKHQTEVHRGTSKLLAKAVETIGGVLSGCSAWLGIDFVGLAASTTRALEQADAICRGEGTRVDAPPLPRVTGPDGIVYLHGFASGPTSAKARLIATPLREEGWAVSVPDQNEGHFESFTVSRALALVKRHLRDRTILVGSSLGGYLASMIAASDERVKALVLMAPAFDLARRLGARYGAPAIELWERDGTTEVEHHGYGGKHRLGFAFLADARSHPPFPKLRVSAYVLHGRKDDTVPASLSEAFASKHPGLVELDLVDDDHALLHTADRALAATRRTIERLELRKEPPPSAPKLPPELLS